MKLDKIYASQFLGAHSIDLVFGKPIQFIAGHNARGKSSIAHAVRLALAGDLTRVDEKKDLPLLITDDADQAIVQVIADGDKWAISIPRKGKVKATTGSRDTDPRLPYVLDAQRIARLSDRDRQQFLSGLLGITFHERAVVNALLAKGLDAARVKRIAPSLKIECNEAMKSAKARASEATGQWRQITGENYGSTKAETWTAPVPQFDAQELTDMEAALATTEQSLGEAERELGALQERHRAATAASARLADLRAKAGLLERRRAKLTHDTAQRDEANAQLEAARTAAGDGPRDGLVHELAQVLNAVTIACNVGTMAEPVQDVLEKYEALHGPVEREQGDPAAAARIPALEQALATMQRAVQASERDVRESETAQASIADAQAAAGESIDAETMEEKRQQVEGLRALKTTRANRVRELQKAQADAAAAATKTASAKAVHEDAQAWDAIATALSPEGVQAELLAAALAPFNERLAQSAADLGWPEVQVHGDMRITCGRRLYRMLSDSEKWRADAILAEAASFISGIKLLILDGMDLLDPPSRPALIDWLQVLAEQEEVDTVLVMAALTAPPTGLPPAFEVHWIEDGQCVNTVAEAA